MGTTTRLLLEKLVAGASTKANLISYWNSNAELLDMMAARAGLPGDSDDLAIDIATPSGAGDITKSVSIGPYLDLTAAYKNNDAFICWNARHSGSTATWNVFAPVYDDGYGFLLWGSMDTYLGIYSRYWNGISDGVAFPGAFDLRFKFSYDGNFWAAADVSALTFTDRTPAFVGDAIAAIRKIQATKKGEIDHATLPEFAVVPYQDAKGEWWPGRSLGDMVSVLTVAIQQLAVNYDAAIAERDSKIEELSKRIDALAAKLPA